MADTPDYDLDAVVAERKPRKPFTFRFAGVVYTLPGQIDARAAAAMQAGDLYAGLKFMLGEEQWETMSAAKAVFDFDSLQGLLDRYGEHIGASMGESEASTGSSGSTGRRSKPTSNGSTAPILVR